MNKWNDCMARSRQKQSARKLQHKIEAIDAFLKSLAKSSNDIEFVIHVAEIFGRLHWSNFSGKYRDDFFEQRAIELLKDTTGNMLPEKNKKTLHVISEPYKTGGHTRLMERLVEMTPEQADILVTRKYDPESKSLKKFSFSKIYSSENGFSLNEIKDIAECYEIVCLHINPDDIIASLAVILSKRNVNNRVIFVNHADHVFSFGLYSADTIAEVSAFGLEISKKSRYCKSCYLGIPLDFETLPQTRFKKNDEYIILSSGNSLKYKPDHNISFPNIASKLLDEIKNIKIIVIGPDINDSWWKKEIRKNANKLIIIRSMPYVEYHQFIRQSDLYIDSLPIPGGTALPEIRALGIPITGIITGISGYSPLDRAKFTNANDMINNIKDYFTKGGGEITKRNNDIHITSSTKAAHGKLFVKNRYVSLLNGRCDEDFKPLNNGVSADYFEQEWRLSNTIRISIRDIIVLFYLSIFSKKINIMYLISGIIIKKAILKVIRYTKNFYNYD